MDSLETFENFNDIEWEYKGSEFFRGIKAPGSIEKSQSKIKKI